MDNLLPLYAQIIDSICPCTKKEFTLEFDNSIKRALSDKLSKKSLRNHRSEIAGQLFGMYFTTKEGIVCAAKRTRKFLADNDTPAFFKDVCFKMQFPNGCQAMKTVTNMMDNSIRIRQFPFLLKVMLLAKSKKVTLTKKEIGYYILNSLDVLQGNASPLEVYDAIASDRKNGIERDIRTPGKAASYDWQHITEQINLLELANLVITDKEKISLNPREQKAIKIFAESYTDKQLGFDVYSYDFDVKTDRKRFTVAWDFYFSELSDKNENFYTTVRALGTPVDVPVTDKFIDIQKDDKTKIGDDGEKYVYEHEKRRVAQFNPRLIGKVLHLGKIHGLGYDIQSVVAEEGENADFAKYIEVKATKRVTAPDITDGEWIDTFNLTRNEWVASQQHRSSYSIYRVYFTRDSVIMFVLTDIAQKCDEETIQAVPTAYRLDFKSNAVDEVIRSEGGDIANA
jgi:hypothetical protein